MMQWLSVKITVTNWIYRAEQALSLVHYLREETDEKIVKSLKSAA